MISRKLATSLILASLTLGGCAVVDRRADRREAQWEAQYPPTGQLVDVDGRKVHAEVFGHGPDLVLIHGASGNTRDFTFDLVGKLKDRYRVIVFDRPGLGWSDDLGDAGISPLVQADALRAAAAKLGVRHPIVLGQSYGGAVALAWALRDPQGPAALVILAGATMPWEGGLGPWYGVTASKVGGATIVPLLTAFAPLSRTEGIIETIFRPEPVPPGYAEYVGAPLTLRRDSFRTNARQVGNLKPYLWKMSAQYRSLDLPVELVHGLEDPIVPSQVHAEQIVHLLPNAHLTLIEGAGHMIHHTRQPEVIAAIDRAAARAGLR
jgi:pimeloyl-ACP methyl ester carboxylesterase